MLRYHGRRNATTAEQVSKYALATLGQCRQPVWPPITPTPLLTWGAHVVLDEASMLFCTTWGMNIRTACQANWHTRVRVQGIDVDFCLSRYDRTPACDS